jgi:hypothetical protein
MRRTAIGAWPGGDLSFRMCAMHRARTPTQLDERMQFLGVARHHSARASDYAATGGSSPSWVNEVMI